VEGADGIQADPLGHGRRRKRTLAVHTGGIGDLLLAGPAIAHLGRDGIVDLAGIPERGRLLQEAGIVQRAFDLDRIDFGSVFAEPSEKLADHLSQYDDVVIWMQDADGQIARQLSPLCPGTVRCYPGLPPKSEQVHATAYYCGCVGAPVPSHWLLEGTWHVNQGAGYLIHPGSGGKSKQWPLASFRAVASRFAEAGHAVDWMLGPAEAHLHEALPHAKRPGTLAEAADLLRQTRLYIGNDSGMTHLASVLGVATVAVFGPTDPLRWGPIGPRTRIVAGAPWPAAEAVLASAEEALSL